MKNIDLSLESSIKDIADYLLEKQIIKKTPTNCSIEKPGEGNMNLVLRFNYDKKQLILKQSKPFVNKYPSIPAPEERIFTEATFYDYASQIEGVQGLMPKIIHFDSSNHLMVMEDLGDGADYSFLYQKGKSMSEQELKDVLNFLTLLHGTSWSEEKQQKFPTNLKLRELNHQHIFLIPFQKDNGLNLDEIQGGLGDVAQAYVNDQAIKDLAEKLGCIYLSQGDTLIHGDYYPGSWMKNQSGLKIIDPEFSFMGCSEFELGVFIAHMKMAGSDLESIKEVIGENYGHAYDSTLAFQFAGIEIMRRTLGVAQLPLEIDIQEKANLLSAAKEMLNL